jgi:hypothetical protein
MPPLRVLLVAATCAAASVAGTPGRGPFTVVGPKIFDSTGTQVVFRGFSASCTEYMARPGFADESDSGAESPNHPGAAAFENNVRRAVLGDGNGDWPGKFAWSCFGGAPAPNVSFQLNPEVGYMLNYLRPDTAGGAFVTQPSVTKVAFGAPYDEVVPTGSPRVIPIVRVPVTAGTWLYDIDASDILSSGYRAILDMMITNLTSNGVAVIIDMHASCGGSKINCTRSGPMALRNFGGEMGVGGGVGVPPRLQDRRRPEACGSRPGAIAASLVLYSLLSSPASTSSRARRVPWGPRLLGQRLQDLRRQRPRAVRIV